MYKHNSEPYYPLEYKGLNKVRKYELNYLVSQYGTMTLLKTINMINYQYYVNYQLIIKTFSPPGSTPKLRILAETK